MTAVFREKFLIKIYYFEWTLRYIDYVSIKLFKNGRPKAEGKLGSQHYEAVI